MRWPGLHKTLGSNSTTTIIKARTRYSCEYYKELLIMKLGNGLEGSNRFVSAERRGHSEKKVKGVKPISYGGKRVDEESEEEGGAKFK